MFTIRYAAFTSDNDQVKPTGKDYATMLEQTKNKVYIYIYILHIKLNNSIYSCAITYSHTVNVNLMLICIELSEMWSFTVNMPENSRYLK